MLHRYSTLTSWKRKTSGESKIRESGRVVKRVFHFDVAIVPFIMIFIALIVYANKV